MVKMTDKAPLNDRKSLWLSIIASTIVGLVLWLLNYISTLVSQQIWIQAIVVMIILFVLLVVEIWIYKNLK